jgi:homoserine kinase
MEPMRVTVRVPASTANLGPGFDILAMALQLQMEVRGERIDDPGIEIDPDPDHPELADARRNLIATSYMGACNELGVTPFSRGVRIAVRSDIPVSRGLGSSAACVIAGVLLANALRGGGRWDEHDVIARAAAIEGHPDNVAAAMLGGLVISAPGAPSQRIDVPEQLQCVLFIPDMELSTQKARTVVPAHFSRAEAVFNASRCALLVRALMSGDLDSLGVAMEDRWHQPQRAALMPWLPEMIAAARSAGAHGAALSGAGPAVLALASGDTSGIERAMAEAGLSHNVPGHVRTVAVRNFGTRVDVSA